MEFIIYQIGCSVALRIIAWWTETNLNFFVVPFSIKDNVNHWLRLAPG